MKVINLTKDQFDKLVTDTSNTTAEWNYLGDKPAIVDFYASWCGPCKYLSPIMDQLAEEYGDKIYIYKVDIDKERELSGAFAVRSVPTLLFIPMEGKPHIAQGALPKEELENAIKNVLL